MRTFFKLRNIIAAGAAAMALSSPVFAQAWQGQVGVSVGFPFAPFWGFGIGYSTPLPPHPNGGAAGAPDSGVRISMTPPEAAVYVDGYYAGTVENFNGTFQKLKLEPGTHDIVIYLEGYRSRHEHVYVGPDSTTKINGTLEKLAPGEPNDPVPQPQPSVTQGPPPNNGQGQGQPGPPPRGRQGRGGPNGPPPQGRGAPAPESQSSAGAISIRVQPDSAEILIDGEHWSGRTDDRLVVSLLPGRHIVEIRLTGYRTYSTEVEVRPGTTVPLNVSLTPDK